METTEKATPTAVRPPIKKKTKGFKNRPYVTARIRGELIGRLMGYTYTEIYKKMDNLGLSVQSLDDCIKFLNMFLTIK